MNIPFMRPSMFLMSSSMPASVSSILSFYASLCSTYMIGRGMWDQFVRTIPDPVRTYIYSRFCRFFKFLSYATDTDLTMVIGQYTNGAKNQIYEAAGFYLQNKISPDTKRLQLSKTPRETKASVTIDRDQEIVDVFGKVKLTWSFVTNGKQSSMHSYRRHDHDDNDDGSQFGDGGHFVLTFPSMNKDLVMDEYVPYVFEEANKIKKEQKVIKIYSRSGGYSSYDGNWGSANLEHPSTFDTLAMEPELMKTILEDLDMFVSRGEFYKNVGKAWKRGYLLYGPPGTGKSSLIAAMANYLKFDVYDLELTSVSNDKDLKKILLSTTNRSILVIEDIDCSVKVRNRQREREEESSDSCSDSDNNNNKPARNRRYHQSKFTLSGLLNFTDGLWSSCGDERIVVFTSNHKERLDPALLRPGRMDMHIHMSYCTPNGFKILASNYHGIGEDKRHRLCEEIEGLILSTEVTPAEVAEELMRSTDADVALQALVDFVKRKKVENEERKAAEEEKKRERRLRRMRRKEAEENIGDKSELVAELRKQIKKLKCERANYDYDDD